MSIGLHLIPIPCLFDYQPSHLFHMPRSQITSIQFITTGYTMHFISQAYALYRVYHKSNDPINQVNKNKITCSRSCSSQEPSLRREECPRLGGRLSLRRDHDKGAGRLSQARLDEPSLA